MGVLIFKKMIYREDVRKGFPDTIFLFGDNMQRSGFGGQAKEMRGEPNSFGVPTKWKPSNTEDSFFSDDMTTENHDLVIGAINFAFDLSKSWLLSYRKHCVCIPKDGLGTGLSQLPERAPKILRYIELKIDVLKNLSDDIRHE